MKKPKPSDKVKIKTKDKEFTGMIMPRPQILDKDITVLKLSSGYNIGIKDDTITDIKIIKESSDTSSKNKQEVKKDNASQENTRDTKDKKDLPKVSILSIGGTISSKVDYKTGGVVADYTAKDFLEMIPQLKNIADLKARKIASIMSEDMNPDDWSMIAKEIKEEIKNEDPDGIVLTQGTDTLHYTSSALSFMIKDLNIPIVITASQRSIDRGSSDAFMNLSCAVNIAARSDIAEVTVCMHGSTDDDYCLVLRGTKVKKMHSSRRDAFRPINTLPIAKIYSSGKVEMIDPYYNKKDKKIKTKDKITIMPDFKKDIALIYTYPGISPKQLDIYKSYKGIVIAGTGLGNIPQDLFTKVKELIDNGLIVIITTQTIYGATHPLVYQNLRLLSVKLGCIFLKDCTPETAYVKLGHILAYEKDKDKIKQQLEQDISKEISERNLANTFLY